MEVEDHNDQGSLAGEPRMKELKLDDEISLCQDPCPRESFSNESQTSSLEAPSSLEIIPLARPQETNASNNDTLEKEGKYNSSAAEHPDKLEESNMEERQSDGGAEVGNHLGISITPLSADLISPEIQETNYNIDEDSIVPIQATERSFLVPQKQDKSNSPSKERPRKAFFKIAAKGRQALGRVFNRRSSVQ